MTKEFSYMLMKSGTVVLKAQTDMKGYTPGQIIQVMANISNQSGKSTGHMVASLVQVRALACRKCFFLLSGLSFLKKKTMSQMTCFHSMLERELRDQEAHP